MRGYGGPTAPTDDPNRLKLLIDALVDHAIYMLDPAGIVTTWNRGAERVKGYRADEIIGRSFACFFTTEDQARGAPAAMLGEARRTGRCEAEGWRVRKDGRRFWAATVTDAIYDPTGRVTGFAKITRDMTERRAAEQAAAESERRFRLLANAVTDYALQMLDPDGRVSAWNAGAERMKGYRAEEIIGSHFSCFYTEEDRRAGAPARNLEAARRDGRFETEGWRTRKDGSCLWAHVIIEAVRNEGGALIGFAKVTRDVTERREAQRKLDQTREALFQSQKMESLGQLTGGIAHDFNNVLAAIANNLELARSRANADDKLRRQIESALQAARNGAGLVRQMLVFARKQPHRLETVDLNAVIENLASILRRTCPENVSIATELEPGLPTAEADPHLLQTALLNLVLNARDAMSGGGTIRIATARRSSPESEARGHVEISVADAGVGMSPETRARAMEPFFTTKEIGKGLGLSMVYGALRQMNGDVTIESELGRGTTVRLLLRATESANAVCAAAPAAERASAGGQKVLLVEDDVIVAMATAELLESAGYAVVQAGRAEQALAALAHHPDVAILITDIGLPGMNGQDLAAESRRRRPGLKVLFITGYDRGGANAALQDGETICLGKPYLPEELFAALQTLGPQPRPALVA